MRFKGKEEGTQAIQCLKIFKGKRESRTYISVEGLGGAEGCRQETGVASSRGRSGWQEVTVKTGAGKAL